MTTPAPITGAMLEDVSWAYAGQLNTPQINMIFNDTGADAFAEVTKRLANTGAITGVTQRLAIVLDGKVESAPSVEDEITGGQAEITGSFTVDEAKNLASVLQTGSLPVDLVVVSGTGPTTTP